MKYRRVKKHSYVVRPSVNFFRLYQVYSNVICTGKIIMNILEFSANLLKKVFISLKKSLKGCTFCHKDSTLEIGVL